MSNINIEDMNDSLRFGSLLGHTEIKKDGTLIARGSATCWTDITSNLIARRLTSTSGKLDYNYTNNSITMQKGGSITNSADTLMFNFQVPHGAKIDSLMKLHIHWEQDNSNIKTITIKHRIQKNGHNKETAWTTSVIDLDSNNNAFPYTAGTLNQITPLVDVDLTDYNISDTVQFQMCRTDGTTGDLEAVFIDAHVEIDMLGSKEEYVK